MLAAFVRVGFAAVAVVASVHAASVQAAEPSIEDVVPARDGELLTCFVHTASLPGGRLRSSLESGLPAAIEMALDVLDDRNHVVGSNRVSLRIAFDLWEQIFHVQGIGDDERFDDLDGLQNYLRAMPRVPVTPFATLNIAERHRVRVELTLHPVARRESERLSDWVEGRESRDGTTRDSDGREVSVSLGRVIRFFYRGARRDDAGELERLSAWFVPRDLGEVER